MVRSLTPSFAARSSSVRPCLNPRSASKRRNARAVCPTSPRRYTLSSSPEPGFRGRKPFGNDLAPKARTFAIDLCHERDRPTLRSRTAPQGPRQSRDVTMKRPQSFAGPFSLCPNSARTLKIGADQGRFSRSQVVERAANTRYLRASGRIRSPLSPRLKFQCSLRIGLVRSPFAPRLRHESFICCSRRLRKEPHVGAA